MRLVTIKTPSGQSKHVLDIARSAGISHVSVQQIQLHHDAQQPAPYDLVELETSTPRARDFLTRVTDSQSFDSKSWIIAVRHPRGLVTSRDIPEETYPFITPSIEILEELWQFSHLTISLVCRVFLAALLLSYGMIELNIPVMIAGLLFLPYHHQMLAIAFAACTRSWRLAGRAFASLLLSTLLITAAGASVAALMEGPLKFHHFGSLKSGFLIALVIGVAAALASADDAGRRELIGLAATAHITVLPAWFGIAMIFGVAENTTVTERAISFLVNVTTLIISALAVYALLRLRVPAPLRDKQA